MIELDDNITLAIVSVLCLIFFASIFVYCKIAERDLIHRMLDTSSTTTQEVGEQCKQNYAVLCTDQISMKDKIFTVMQPPEWLERVSTLKYQRRKETDCSSFRPVPPEPKCCGTTSPIPLDFGESSTQVTGDTECDNAPSDEEGAICSVVETRTAAGDDGNTCLVCWDKDADAILLECGHSGICTVCAQSLWHRSRHCPLCREGFAAIMHIVDRHDLMVRARTL